jgi:hypothetical protein
MITLSTVLARVDALELAFEPGRKFECLQTNKTVRIK